MCTKKKLKKIKKLCVPPRGSMTPLMSQNCTRLAEDISKCIEGGSMKLTTLVDYIYVSAVTNAFPCNDCIFFLMYLTF